MERTITVKGTGKVSAKPDLIVVRMEITSRAARYEVTMNGAATAISRLQNAIEKADFEKTVLKTTDFSIDTDYESYRDEDGNYKSRFRGYVCVQKTKLEFPLDTNRLSRLIEQVSNSKAEPNLSIHFTVKDADALQDALLVNAAQNARHRAELLAKGAGATLGELLQIDYTWDELHVFSPTRLTFSEDILYSQERMPDLEPDDIDLSDYATFVWALS
ncbi:MULTISPECIES: SIMPL domain-containing protein [Exiguobacterium]|uniref:SIMPL domain-containing protein n=1 Tax=Exiguobacterium TaxID=33986 RepID=UPI001BE6F118|nr:MULTISPECIES: SIMPL domain-containing protein [Exiguobacterium]MCT4783429.1 SIMPL domain-containing protein [Exiguobacterium himgiriensis]